MKSLVILVLLSVFLHESLQQCFSCYPTIGQYNCPCPTYGQWSIQGYIQGYNIGFAQGSMQCNFGNICDNQCDRTTTCAATTYRPTYQPTYRPTYEPTYIPTYGPNYGSTAVTPVTSQSTATPTTITTVMTTTPCSSEISLVTLHRLFNTATDDHFYTAGLPEADNAVVTYGYQYQISPGLVATSANDCLCGATLKPVYRLYRSGDHFYTSDESEATGAVNIYGYVRETIAFYCSDQLNYCGATLPLYRYQRNSEHFYTTNSTEAVGNYEGITCYIWPV